MELLSVILYELGVDGYAATTVAVKIAVNRNFTPTKYP